MNAKEMIERINFLRSTIGKPAIKGAGTSKQALQVTINQLEKEVAELHPADGDTITLAQVARDMGINPKVARAKWRRLPEVVNEEIAELMQAHATEEVFEAKGHTFPATLRSRIEDILSHDFRMKTEEG